MRKLVNGVVHEMTAEEVAEYERMAAEIPVPEPTQDEWKTQIEAALIELAALITGGV